MKEKGRVWERYLEGERLSRGGKVVYAGKRCPKKNYVKGKLAHALAIVGYSYGEPYKREFSYLPGLSGEKRTPR